MKLKTKMRLTEQELLERISSRLGWIIFILILFGIGTLE